MSKLLRLPIREASKAAAEYAVQRHGGEVVQTTLEGATAYAVRGSKVDLQTLAEAANYQLCFGEPALEGNYTVHFHVEGELLVIAVWRA